MLMRRLMGLLSGASSRPCQEGLPFRRVSSCELLSWESACVFLRSDSTDCYFVGKCGRSLLWHNIPTSSPDEFSESATTAVG